MSKLKSMDELFERRHFDREVIILCVRWYLRCKLSLRDLVEMMAERGLSMAQVLSTCGQLGVDAAIMSAMKPATQQNTPVTDNPLSYVGYRFPPDVISYAVWLYYRFPLSLRMVEELLAARGIELTYETVRRWSVKFGLGIARRIRSTALARGDKWHLDEGVSRTQAKACGAVLKMGVGLPESACRSRLQTARCCCVQKAWR